MLVMLFSSHRLWVDGIRRKRKEKKKRRKGKKRKKRGEKK